MPPICWRTILLTIIINIVIQLALHPVLGSDPHNTDSRHLHTRVFKRSNAVLPLWESIQPPENVYDDKSTHPLSRDEKTANYLDTGVKTKEDVNEEYSRSPKSIANVSEPHEDHSIHVASWQWEYVRTPFIYTAVVIVAGLVKIGFHHAGFLSSIIPESCMLIILGIIVGTIVHFTHSRELLPQFTPKAFFLFLLPPIVLESAYSLHDRAFFSNLGTIILYAVLGTLINCFAIGTSLFGLSQSGALGYTGLQLVECFVFSALISAVDPVAVLAIFQEVGVNKSLYFLVFGESLLNDAVTIVLYMMMVGFSKADYISADQVGMGVAAFLCVSLGGLAIGILMGVVTALITKRTEDVRVVEPLAMIGVAYLSYLLAEMVHFSGIISIIGCGIVQAHYASKNISQKSNTTVKYFTKMVSAVCDTVIFLFLGMVLVDDQHQWHTGFVLWSTGLCFVFRFMGVFLLTYCANKLERTRRINTEEQFIMAYGGLRGAVAFSLVVMLDDTSEHKQLFITATLFIILFTVFIQGATIKPLVILLKIRRQAAKTSSSLFTEVNKKLLDHVMAGVEEVTGDHGGNYWKQLLLYYNTKYLKKWLQCDHRESNLTRVYTRMMLEDHFAHLYGPATVIEDKKPLLIHRNSDEKDGDVIEFLTPLDVETEEEKELQQEEIDHFEEIPQKEVSFSEAEMEAKPLKNKKLERPKSPSSGTSPRPPLIKRQTTLSLFKKPEEDDPSRLLQKALHDNPYNKLHHKYNPNLVGDEDQDMDAHLRARRVRARRLTLLAMHNNGQSDIDASDRLPTEIGDVEVNPALETAINYFLQRAQKRRTLRRENTSEQSTTAPSPWTKVLKLERQKAISDVREPSSDLDRVVEEKEDNEETNTHKPGSFCNFFRTEKKPVESKV